ncbi:hypothetical protein CBR_g19348 [Chara braunii]|uniref:Uncharacterized protein n=1 Tax=Chara braunii TaxID=69332 RepID=A0A388KXQ0_CHABU|nr:hypothetical protein CBR_g19348 [Chara braunii]|eukprot:GBG74836.1 hypothetical protein CBR_g19348 [Chara braunii]
MTMTRRKREGGGRRRRWQAEGGRKTRRRQRARGRDDDGSEEEEGRWAMAGGRRHEDMEEAEGKWRMTKRLRRKKAGGGRCRWRRKRVMRRKTQRRKRAGGEEEDEWRRKTVTGRRRRGAGGHVQGEGPWRTTAGGRWRKRERGEGRGKREGRGRWRPLTGTLRIGDVDPLSARAPTLSYRVKENSAPLLSEEKWDAWWEDYIELAFYLLEIEIRWSEAAPFGEGPEHPEDSVELLIIQAWRTAEQGDLLGIVFAKVEEGNLTLITDELLVFLTQLVDDLPLDILSRSDEHPGTHVLSRALEPHLVWSTCTEIDEDNCLYPSQAFYLEIDVTDLTFWDLIARRNAAQDEEIGGAEEEEEEEEPSGGERDYQDYVPERETGIAGGSSQSQEKNEEEEEQRKRKRRETAEGKQPTANVSWIGDPWRDPEPQEEEDDGTSAKGSRRRRRRSESPTPSGSPS